MSDARAVWQRQDFRQLRVRCSSEQALGTLVFTLLFGLGQVL